jgi:hypothetical protein
MTITRTRARLPGNQIGICSRRERQLAVAWEYCRRRQAVEGDVYERWKPAGYPSMSPYRICKHGNFILFFAGSTRWCFLAARLQLRLDA